MLQILIQSYTVHVKRFVFLIALVCFSMQIFAQRTQDNRDNNSNTVGGDTLVIQREDTLSNDIFTFSLDKIQQNKLLVDTSLHFFHEYEKTRDQDQLYITTGNLGASAFPIFYLPNYKSGFELGHRQHEPYQMEIEDIKFYNLEKPFTDLYFSPAGSQQSFTAAAKMGRDFANNVKVSIDYQRINAEEIYDNQTTRHTYLHAGVFQKIPDTRWAYTVNFLSNSNFEGTNGGILNENDLIGNFRNIRTNVPVFVSDANIYNLSRQYLGRLYFFLQDKKNIQQFVSLEYIRNNQLYKVVAEDFDEGDSIRLYPEYLDEGLGLRLNNQMNSNTAKFSYNLNTKVFSTMIYGQYGLHTIVDSPITNRYSDAIVGTDTELTWRNFDLELDGLFGVSAGQALILLDPQLSFQYKNWLNLKAGIRFHTRPMDYVERQMIINTNMVYQNDFPVTTIQEIHGSFGIPKIGLDVNVRSIAMQNAIRMDSITQRFELEPNVNLLQVTAADRVHIWNIELYNMISTQIENTEIYNSPIWHSRHGLSYHGALFDSKLFLHAGVTMDLFPGYTLPGYDILTSRLYRTDIESEGWQYRLDAHINIRVQQFRFFIKYENLSNLWTDKVLFQISTYPQLDARLRLGIAWQLRN